MEDKNPNLQSTTVKGDPIEIEALKKMGHGMLSHAFRVGCKVVLGTTSPELEQLMIKRKEMEAQRNYFEGIIAQIDATISEMQNKKAQLTIADEMASTKFEFAVSEYIRCSPLILYKNMTQLAEHLAGLMDLTSVGDVRAFFDGRKREPTEDEIRDFLRRQA